MSEYSKPSIRKLNMVSMHGLGKKAFCSGNNSRKQPEADFIVKQKETKEKK